MEPKEISYAEARELRKMFPGPSLDTGNWRDDERSAAVQILDLDQGRLVVLEQVWRRPEGVTEWWDAKAEDVSARLLYDGTDAQEAYAAAKEAEGRFEHLGAGRYLSNGITRSAEEIELLQEGNRKLRHGPTLFAAPLPPTQPSDGGLEP